MVLSHQTGVRIPVAPPDPVKERISSGTGGRNLQGNSNLCENKNQEKAKELWSGLCIKRSRDENIYS